MTLRAILRRRMPSHDGHLPVTKITDKRTRLRAQERGCSSGSSIRAKRVRTLFLSDIHLGTKGCQAEKLLDFLRHYEADTIYLVGDIVDGWQLRVELVLAAEPQRRRAEAPAQGPQRRPPDLHPRQPRRVPARLLRHAFRRHRRARGHHPRRRRRPALPGRARRPVRRRDPPRALAGPARQQRLRPGDLRSTPISTRSAACSA